MSAAIADVEQQLYEMPVTELLGTEDLEWSFSGPKGWTLFVEVTREVRPGDQLDLAITCHASTILRRHDLSRTVTLRVDPA